ncbi:hypothetical protein QBC41DRAFT_207721, partial [Cercophora samala]
MSPAKDKPSGIPVPSNPATTSPTATTSPIHRRSSGGSQVSPKSTRVKFEEEQKPEAADEKTPKVEEEEKEEEQKPKVEPEEKPQVQQEKKPEVVEISPQNIAQSQQNDDPTNTDDAPSVDPFRFATIADEALPTGLAPIEEDDTEEEEEDDSFQEDPYYLHDDPTVQPDTYQLGDDDDDDEQEDDLDDVPPGNPPMVSNLSKTLSHSADSSPPLPPYLLLHGTLLLFGTLVYALVNSSHVTSLTALLFPGIQLLLAGTVLSLVASQSSVPADTVTPGWKALVQLATVGEWAYFLLELYKDVKGYSAPGAYLPGGYGVDVGFGDYDPADYGTLDHPLWPHEARITATRGRGWNREGEVLEGVDRAVGVAAAAGVVVIVS